MCHPFSMFHKIHLCKGRYSLKKICLCILTLLTFCITTSPSWAGKPLWANVIGENVNTHNKPSTTGQIVEQLGASISGPFIVDATVIEDKGSNLKWYKILYFVSDMDGETYYPAKGALYIATSSVKTRPLTAQEKKSHQDQVKHIAEKEAYKKSGAWRQIDVSEESQIYYQDTNMKSATVYRDTSLKSPKIGSLKLDTPVFVTIGKLRYVKETKETEGWLKLSTPLVGWVPLEHVALTYSEYFTRELF